MPTRKRIPPESSPEGTAAAGPAPSAARVVDERIRAVGGWRGECLAMVRRLIQQAEPEIEEACKWAKASNPLGVPVWSHAGIVCTGEVYQHVVKLTFARGAALPDPETLFNAGLDGNTRRAIDIREGEAVDPAAFTRLIQAAVAENLRVDARKTSRRGRE